jgi:hypothetical protein
MLRLQSSLGSASSVAFCPWERVAARRSGKTWWVVLQLMELSKKHPSQFLGLAMWFGGWKILPTILVEVEVKGWPDGRMEIVRCGAARRRTPTSLLTRGNPYHFLAPTATPWRNRRNL